MSKHYVFIGKGLWKCNRCGKEVKELGWLGHNRYHRNQENKKSTQTKLK